LKKFLKELLLEKLCVPTAQFKSQFLK